MASKISIAASGPLGTWTRRAWQRFVYNGGLAFSTDFQRIVMFTRASYTTAVGLMVATAFAAAQGQTPPPAQTGTPPTPEVTFRTEVNYVEEDVRVVDSRGAFVRNLKRDDFQVLEDGKPQKINTFGMVDIPVVPA